MLTIITVLSSVTDSLCIYKIPHLIARTLGQSKYKLILMGTGQIFVFNTMFYLRLWVWVSNLWNIKVHLWLYRYIRVNELCPYRSASYTWANIASYLKVQFRDFHSTSIHMSNYGYEFLTLQVSKFNSCMWTHIGVKELCLKYCNIQAHSLYVHNDGPIMHASYVIWCNRPRFSH